MSTTRENTTSDIGQEPGSLAPRLTYRPDLDGLRAVAVGLVILYHYGVPGFRGGYVGVDVFFVISGFLITSILVADAERGQFSLRSFYSGRVRRLLPLSTLVLVLTVGFATWALPATSLGILLGDARSALFYFSNWHFATRSVAYTDVQVSEGLLTHFWSLSVEEQFYFVWPALIAVSALLARRSSRLRVLGIARAVAGVVVAGSLIASVAMTADIGGKAYYFTHLRLWEMAAGALLAGVTVSARMPRVARTGAALGALAAIVAAALTLDGNTAFPGSAALVPVLATVALIATGSTLSPVTRVLGASPLRSTGERSYALYLWHWPLLGAVEILDDRYEWKLGRPAIPLIALGATAALTIASHRLLENPLRYSALLKRHSTTTLAAGLAISALLVALSFPLHHTAERAEGRAWARLPLDPAGAAKDLADVVYGSCNQSLAASFEGLQWCEVGDPSGSRTVVLIGDSHAQHWAPAVDAAGKANGWRVLITTRSSCLVYDIAQFNARTGLMDDNCRAWGRAVAADLAARTRVDLVLIGRRYAYAQSIRSDDGSPLADDAASEAIAKGAQSFLRSLAPTVDRVVILDDTPVLPFSMPDCLAAQSPESAARCDSPARELPLEQPLLSGEHEAAASITQPIIRLSSFDDIACPESICSALSPAGIITFRDGGHLTATYSASLAPEVAERIRGFLSR